MAVAPRTTALVEYDEPPLGDRDVRIRSELATPKHGTELHAYLHDQRRLARRFHPEYRIFVPRMGDASGRPFPRPLGNSPWRAASAPPILSPHTPAGVS